MELVLFEQRIRIATMGWGDFTSLTTFTDCTAPNGPNNCHSTFSSVSGAKLYTKMHQPDALIAFPGSIAFASKSLPVNGEYRLRINRKFLNSNYLIYKFIFLSPKSTTWSRSIGMLVQRMMLVMTRRCEPSGCLWSKICSKRRQRFVVAGIVGELHGNRFSGSLWDSSVEHFDGSLGLSTLVESYKTNTLWESLRWVDNSRRLIPNVFYVSTYF